MKRLTWKQLKPRKHQPLTAGQIERNRLRGESRRLRAMGFSQEDTAAKLKCPLSLVQLADRSTTTNLSHEND